MNLHFQLLRVFLEIARGKCEKMITGWRALPSCCSFKSLGGEPACIFKEVGGMSFRGSGV